jgi:hypothetical protein
VTGVYAGEQIVRDLTFQEQDETKIHVANRVIKNAPQKEKSFYRTSLVPSDRLFTVR